MRLCFRPPPHEFEAGKIARHFKSSKEQRYEQGRRLDEELRATAARTCCAARGMTNLVMELDVFMA